MMNLRIPQKSNLFLKLQISRYLSCVLLQTSSGFEMAFAPSGPSPWFLMMNSLSLTCLRKYDVGITPSLLHSFM